MKKFIYFAFCLALTGGIFTSCSDDDDNAIVSTNPGSDVAGTYTGTWSQTLNGETKEVSGTLSVTSTSAYVATLNIPTNSDINISSDLTVPMNVTAAKGSGDVYYILSNGASSNTLSALYGVKGLMQNNTLNVGFIMTVKVGRKSYEYTYTFSGNK